MRHIWLPALIGFLSLGGCGSEPHPTEQPKMEPVASQQSPKNDAVPNTAQKSAEPSANTHTDLAPGQSVPTEDLPKEDLASDQKAYDAAKASYKAKPGDSKLKEAYVKATVKLGTATMLDSSLPPKEKYPKALELYREALKLDPQNEEASNNSAMILTVYESMGKKPPQAPSGD